MDARIELISFSYKDNEVPEADLVLDTRRFLYDPSRLRPDLAYSDGTTDEVQKAVVTTPGAPLALSLGLLFADSLARLGKPCVIAIGCSHGRHRSVALVELIATALRVNELDPQVRHLRLELLRANDNTSTENA